MGQNAPSGGNAVNLKTGRPAPKHRSTYDLGYRFADTVRYGFVTPFFKFDGIAGDKVSLRSAHNLRTLSLKSPLFQNLRMNKDFYACPLKALLPLNWDKLFNNPVQGDDVVPHNVNTLFVENGDNYCFMRTLMGAMETLYSTAKAAIATNTQNTFLFLNWMLIIYEDFAGKGNLFNHFKIDPWHGIKPLLDYEPEKVLEYLWKAYHAFLDSYAAQLKAAKMNTRVSIEFLDLEGQSYTSRLYDIDVVKDRLRLFYDICENPYYRMPTYESSIVNYATCNSKAFEILDSMTGGTQDWDEKVFIQAYGVFESEFTSSNPSYVNVAPILAYQMIMAEYFTNDKVDLCYNSDMWRQTIFTYAIKKGLNGNALQGTDFVWNGSVYNYDAFSRIGLFNIVDQYERSQTAGHYAMWISLMHELFGFKRNLKYVDYFTGSRVRPIATGDLNVQVGDGSVNVIDISRNIQMQRFLNQVNRIGPDAKNYLKGIFGTQERQHIDVPVKIGHIDETIYGEEVQNTADAQQSEPNSITTNLKSRGQNFAFEFNVAENTIVLGLVSFSIRRFYNNGIDPFSKKVDRFDMFNPYLQFIGDQPIPLEQLSSQNTKGKIFGYTGRYAEYKNALDYACGDFKEGALKTWIFSDETPEIQSGLYPEHISPEFIRQNPTELDDFYLNMTGEVPSDRYHFIVVFDNLCTATRDMVFNPQILG